MEELVYPVLMGQQLATRPDAVGVSTGAIPSKPSVRCAKAGTTPVTSACSPTRGTSASSIALTT